MITTKDEWNCGALHEECGTATLHTERWLEPALAPLPVDWMAGVSAQAVTAQSTSRGLSTRLLALRISRPTTLPAAS